MYLFNTEHVDRLRGFYTGADSVRRRRQERVEIDQAVKEALGTAQLVRQWTISGRLLGSDIARKIVQYLAQESLQARLTYIVTSRLTRQVQEGTAGSSTESHQNSPMRPVNKTQSTSSRTRSSRGGSTASSGSSSQRPPQDASSSHQAAATATTSPPNGMAESTTSAEVGAANRQTNEHGSLQGGGTKRARPDQKCRTEAGHGDPSRPPQPRRRTRNSAPSDTRSRAELSALSLGVEWERLDEQGWVVLKGAALQHIRTPDTLADIKRNHPTVWDLTNGHTHTQQEGAERTGGRWQIPLSIESVAGLQLHTNMMKMLSNLLPGRGFSTLLAVGARAGCRQQDPHTDFDITTFEKDDVYQPMSVLIALQKGTKLDVYTGSHKSIREWPRVTTHAYPRVSTPSAPLSEVTQPTTLQLERGDVLFFRGDLPHSGSAYNTDNVRLFTYVLQPGHTEERDSDFFPVDFSAHETPPTQLTRLTRAETNTSHPQIDMFKLASDGYLHITDFISMKPSLFDILVRSLTQNALSLFTPESAEIFNQEREGANDGRRRMTSLGEWLTATSNQLEAPDLIRRLTVAVQRIIRALPEGYRPEDLTKEIRIIRSAAGCLQQAAHTDYETDHADFGHFDTLPLSLFFAISTGAKLVLWDQPPHASSPQARTIEFGQGQAILLLGTKTHSGAAYDQENFRGFMYIHKSTYSPPDPRVTYAPRAACPRRPQTTAGRPPGPEEHTPPQELCESSDGDLDDYPGDGLDTPERSGNQHFLQLEKAPTVDSFD